MGSLGGEGSKSEWLIESTDSQAAPGPTVLAGASASVTTRSVFGEKIGSKSEWLRGEDVTAVHPAVLAPRDKGGLTGDKGKVEAAARSRSVSPCKVRRGMSPGGGDCRLPLDAEWVGKLVDAGSERDEAVTVNIAVMDAHGAHGDEDSIQKWGEWMLSTATSTLAHASPGMRYNGAVASSSKGGDKGGATPRKFSPWLLTDPHQKGGSNWLLSESRGCVLCAVVVRT